MWGPGQELVLWLVGKYVRALWGTSITLSKKRQSMIVQEADKQILLRGRPWQNWMKGQAVWSTTSNWGSLVSRPEPGPEYVGIPISKAISVYMNKSFFCSVFSCSVSGFHGRYGAVSVRVTQSANRHAEHLFEIWMWFLAIVLSKQVQESRSWTSSWLVNCGIYIHTHTHAHHSLPSSSTYTVQLY